MRIKGDVLVLNKSWLPIHIISVPNAFRQLCNGAANALDHRTGMVHALESWKGLPVNTGKMEMGDDYLNHGAHVPILIPRILVLTKYDKLPQHVLKYSRGGVYERDNYICQYCGRNFRKNRRDANGRWLINIDHVIPRANPKFPGTNFSNCVTSCVKCNQKKRDRTPEEAGMRLLKKPYTPKWKPFSNGAVEPHVAWKDFLPGETWTRLGQF